MLKQFQRLTKLIVCLSLAVLFTFRSLEPAVALPLSYISAAQTSSSLVTKSIQPSHPGFIPVFLIPELVELLFGLGELVEGIAAAGTVQQAGTAAAGGAVVVAGSKAANQVIKQGAAQVAKQEAKQLARQTAAQTTLRSTTSAGRAGAIAFGRNEITVLTNVAPQVRATRALPEYTLGSGFSAVYHPPTGAWRAVASGRASLKNGRSIRTVDQLGGHAAAEKELAESIGIVPEHPENVGFVLIKESEQTLRIRWNSGTVNARNFNGERAAPFRYRSAIKEAVERETGYQVVG